MAFIRDGDEVRRRAPLHFWQRAENARYVAAHLLTAYLDGDHKSPPSLKYTGTPGVALREAFVRERSLALELIVKAVIAQRIENAGNSEEIPATHNVLQLWRMADLPQLTRADRRRLAETWQILQWAGRYAAPKRGSDGQRSEIARHHPEPIPSNFPPPYDGPQFELILPDSFDWDDFNSLYLIARRQFYALRDMG